MDHFKEDIDYSLKNNSITEYSHFQNIFLEILYKHAPINKKILRFNDNPFMTKALRKAIMHRSKFKNIFHKTRAKEQLQKTGELMCKSSSQYQERLISKTEYKRFDR